MPPPLERPQNDALAPLLRGECRGAGRPRDGRPYPPTVLAAAVLVPLALIFSIEVYGLVAWGTAYLPWETVPAGEAFLPEFRRALHPEAQERWLYLFGLLCVPTLPLAFLALLKRRWARSPETLVRLWEHPVGRYWDRGLLAVVLVWLCGLSLDSEIPAAPTYLLVALFMAVCLPRLQRVKWAVPTLVIHSLAALLVVFGSGLLWVTEEVLRTSHADMPHCLDLPLGAINQVLHGRTVLVDTSSQYGVLYPYVGALFVAAVGLSVTHVSLFFVLLSALSLGWLYLALVRKFGGTISVLLAFAAIVGLSHPYWAWSLEGFPDYFHIPYYQYFPIRVVCGAFFLWFVRVYLERPTWQRRWLGYAAAGFSALWNADTGLVILIAWTGAILYDRLGRAGSRREAARIVAAHLLALFLTLGTSLAWYAMFAWLRTGTLPQLGSYARFQRIYYLNGFGMAPCVMWEFWQPVVLVYAIAVFDCLRRWRQASADRNRSWYLYIALYGLGIFSYYQGRNDLRNLLATCYPAAFLCCCWAADCARHLRGTSLRGAWRHPVKRLALLQLVVFGLMPCAGLASFACAVPSAVAYGCVLAETAGRAVPQPVLTTLAPYPLRGQELIICSDLANYLHVHTQSWSALPFSSCSEVVLVQDIAMIQDLLDRKGPAVVAFRDRDGGFLHVAKYLNFTNYRVAGEHDGTVFLESSMAARDRRPGEDGR